MLNKKSIRDIDVAGKKVFVRVDYNVPMDKAGNITEDTRIRATLPTLQYLLEKKAAVIIACHFGRPKGAVVPEFSVAPIGKRLSSLIDQEVIVAPDCVGAEVEAMAKNLKPGHVLL